MTTNNVSRHCQISSAGWQIVPGLKSTGLRHIYVSLPSSPLFSPSVPAIEGEACDMCVYICSYIASGLIQTSFPCIQSVWHFKTVQSQNSTTDFFNGPATLIPSHRQRKHGLSTVTHNPALPMNSQSILQLSRLNRPTLAVWLLPRTFQSSLQPHYRGIITTNPFNRV